MTSVTGEADRYESETTWAQGEQPEVKQQSDELDYHALNAKLNLLGPNNEIQFEADVQAARKFFLDHVNPNTMFFHDLEEKLHFLIENEYYEREFLDQYDPEFVKSVFKQVYAHKFRFPTFIGAFKYYTSYTLKTFDGKRYLERYEDRVAVNALYLARGDEAMATQLAEELITGRYQPATPTFLNAGRKQRGELVSCFLLRTEDNMESISRTINASLQLSKRGGGVAINLTNLRETGAPIKKIEGQSSGVVPVMKMLEDAFSYANQLGQRSGAGAVYLNVHHPDILKFLDTKRENADEKIRIKTLSIGLVVPDITFELARKNEDMYLFSPYDIERIYGKPMSDIYISEKYEEMVDNPNIKKRKISARKLFQTIAELQFESGYPYLMFEDTVNKANPVDGKISMSNLCSEILQVSTPSTYNEDLSYDVVGKDISCNLGSMNIAKAMESPDLGNTIEGATRGLTAVSEMSNTGSVPSIENGNAKSHAIGLGQMNLHGFLAKERIHYDSPEAIDFTNIYFYVVNYHSLRASNKIAQEKGESFEDFDKSDYANGKYFTKYTEQEWVPTTDTVKALFAKYDVYVPTQEDWRELQANVEEHGVYNSYRLAIPPTGSISYINHSTSSIHPVVSAIENRKEGQIGRVYSPAPYLSMDNIDYYKDAYKIGYEAIIDVYAAATEHTDQGLSLTLFYYNNSTTRDLNRAFIYAWRKGIKTLYYARVRSDSLEGTDDSECVSCIL